jgi:hypothetical protein
LLRLIGHAVFVPAFEGTDEPYHLARIAAFADQPPLPALRGVPTDGQIVSAVQARPCCPSLHRHLGCPPFGGSVAYLNLLHPLPPRPPARAIPNPENNQPPLYYALIGLPLRIAPLVLGDRFFRPETRLLTARLASVLFASLGIWVLFRLFSDGRGRRVLLGVLLFMTLPGASESLARCSNDAAAFAWAAAAVWALRRRASTLWISVLAASGPLIKLTAFPVVVFVVVALWVVNRRRTAVVSGLASLCVFPLQFLRGWRWGGTYELNQPAAPLGGTLTEVAVGLGRSAYTFFKTAFWLGNWSFFRPPTLLLAGFWLLLLLWTVAARARPEARLPLPHLVAAVAASVAMLLFFFGHRRFWGDWGGVGGWYLWAWIPWIAAAANDLLRLRASARVPLLVVTAAFAVVANLFYFRIAVGLYGLTP